MLADVIFHNVRHRLFYLMNPGIAKFLNLATNRTHDVVMLLAEMRLLKLGNVLPKLMLYHQPAVQQQLHRVVQSSPADLIVVVLHADIEGLYIKMPVLGINLI